MGYKGIKAKLEVNNEDFVKEIMISKGRNELTAKAVDYFIKIANHAIRKLHHKDPRDREDCIQFALLDLLLYWRNFDPTVSNNAFAFYTQMTYNGYAKGYKKIHKAGSGDVMSLDMVGDSEIFSV
jgi:DNA-directed RNA polymerase specialized sigma subunit